MRISFSKMYLSILIQRCNTSYKCYKGFIIHKVVCRIKVNDPGWDKQPAWPQQQSWSPPNSELSPSAASLMLDKCHSITHQIHHRCPGLQPIKCIVSLFKNTQILWGLATCKFPRTALDPRASYQP